MPIIVDLPAPLGPKEGHELPTVNRQINAVHCYFPDQMFWSDPLLQE